MANFHHVTPPLSAAVPDGIGFTFALTASLEKKGSPGGIINFVFSAVFGQAWSAVPGVGDIHLPGNPTSFTVAANGAAIPGGQLTEEAFARGSGVASVEENVQFGTMLRPGAPLITLLWQRLFRIGNRGWSEDAYRCAHGREGGEKDLPFLDRLACQQSIEWDAGTKVQRSMII
jgi:hypothetical protein